VERATRVAIALCCTVNETSVFARKNYFYPDLPKGYQISQFDRPLASAGYLVIGELEGGAPMKIGVTRVHMEEDAGKSVHDRYSGHTAIDLNRAGVPLVEIVSEPDIRSAAEAGAYLRSVKQIVEYVKASDANMEEGSLRVDANISVRVRGTSKFGNRTEIKNMNSFSSVERAIDAEFLRQCEMLERGEKVQQQTLLWDDVRREVRPSRSKEDSHDYRYFPEPDLPPLVLDKDWLKRVRDEMPELPAVRRQRFAKEYALGEQDVEVLTADAALAEYYESVARQHGDAKAAANWVVRDVLSAVNETGQSIAHFTVRPADLADLLDMVRDGRLSRAAAARAFAIMVKTGDSAETIAEREGLALVSDDAPLRAWVDEVCEAHPAETARFVGGERKLLGVLVGLVMKRSNGSADPKRVNQLLEERAKR
jgi:aspartyl-tRNA(Asn)/glutamyl-tRNA(Gln) amidotransferase subunit B